MVVVIACGILVLIGLAAAVVWGGRPFLSPPADPAPSAAEVARRFAWYGAILFLAGIGAGLTVGRPGGRLAMRLLAMTAGDDAQGRITEAGRVVGRITVDGTIDLVVFNGVFGGLFAGATYLLVRRYLPPGRLGALLFGLAILVVVGTTIDPLRRGNPDFDLVGPGWVSVAVFSLVVIAFALTLAALAARLSSWLPLPGPNLVTLRRYALPIVLAAIVFPVTVVMLGIGCVAVLATRWPALPAAVRSTRAVLAGRIVMAAGVAVALPGAVLALVDIASR